MILCVTILMVTFLLNFQQTSQRPTNRSHRAASHSRHPRRPWVPMIDIIMVRCSDGFSMVLLYSMKSPSLHLSRCWAQRVLIAQDSPDVSVALFCYR
ncbi:hypothetical protein DFJ58DRAFT_338303 [Suillus subalutaceus]|uniref:uncharacterized protein n=1 Tax=Suillus subalutaceus TaxID=48586 RepID=UPI001B863694|nr:uncharacterized protein DFJ58DRAFT_338303 [Suillus subalutaceus]KAG1856672.1 hypothetical protein DFJ58DRAFT_338303 [Suillus subalutaceus]